MSSLGLYTDAPDKIVNEGREITITLDRTTPTTATIKWTLPKGAPGCSINDLNYNGIVIVADTCEINQNQTPENKRFYTGDPTVDVNLFAGDKIGTGLVVGAFYDDKTTTSMKITGLQPNVPYYVAGFAVDNVLTYHYEGSHSYSQDYQSKKEPDTPGYQVVQLGVQSTDRTGLDVNKTYKLSIMIDGYQYGDPYGPGVLYPNEEFLDETYLTGNSTLQQQLVFKHIIPVEGSNNQTYQQLVNSLNFAFATLNSPLQGPTPPGTGTLFINPSTNTLYLWDGASNQPLDAITGSVVPTSPGIGGLWLNTQTNKLSMWDGITWISQANITYPSDPTQPGCDTIWYDGNKSFAWDGSVWIPVNTITQSTDPSLSPVMPCGSYWLNSTTNVLSSWGITNGDCSSQRCPLVPGQTSTGVWNPTNAFVWLDDPRLIPDGYYWFNTTNNKLTYRMSGQWTSIFTSVIVSTATTSPIAQGVNSFWYNPDLETLHQWSGAVWVDISSYLIIWFTDPTTPAADSLYFDETKLHVWDTVNQMWTIVNNFVDSPTNPAKAPSLVKPTIWVNGNSILLWDGMQWINPCLISNASDPTHVSTGTFWFNSTSHKWSIKTGSGWSPINYISSDVIPTSLVVGQYWYNTDAKTLFVWNGVSWVPLMFQTQPFSMASGTQWYNTNDQTLYEWKNLKWEKKRVPNVRLNEYGHFIFTSGTSGSQSRMAIIPNDPIADDLLFCLTPKGLAQSPTTGTDGLLPGPSYREIGIGTDGSSARRRDMVENILTQLGYPIVQVELTKEQLEFCVDQAFQTLRRRGSAGYQRVMFFFNLEPGQQKYKLTNRSVGFHKIVSVMGMMRMSSAFLGTAEGQGVYGQIVLQHLYQMGTFDLVSYHVINEYLELMEKLFASNIMYFWEETTRTLTVHQNLWRPERVLMDAVIERTEQDILADRYLNNWIQTWATGEACQLLAEIRGKYATLPGAGGGVSLNAVDLRARAQASFQQCLDDLDNSIASNPEEIGLGCSIIMG
jgi:hypothetical protein